MGLNIIQSLIMGFVSGLTQMLPVSAEAHRSLLRLFFGVEQEGPVFLLLSHIAALTVVILCCRRDINRLRRASRLLRVPARRRRQQPDFESVSTIRHLRTAVPVVILGLLFSVFTAPLGGYLLFLSAAMLVGGVLLWLPNVVRSGNKDSRNMSRLDGFLMALGGALSLIPGISCLGAAYSAGVARGVERKYALRFSWLLLIAALGVRIVLDLLSVIGGGAALSTYAVLIAVCGAVSTAFGSWCGIRLCQSMVKARGLSGFAYYCWGFSLLCFVLFLFL